MVDLHLVVQGQRVITIAPVVTDTLFAVYNQRIDLQLTQAGGDRKAGLPPADDQYKRIPLDILGGGSPEVEPVGAAKIARIGLTFGPQSPDLFFEPLYLVERREQRPRLQRVAVVGIGGQP
jgi:hypothetical protein